MNGKLIYIASKGEYILITPMALTPDIKDKIQDDMSERLREQVSVISGCSSFEYIPPRVKTTKDDQEDVK